MKRLSRFAIVAIFVLVMVLSACLLVACGDNGGGTKQVPVYKGMTISRSIASASASAADDGEHGEYVEPQHKPGHIEGDHDHRDDDFDQNKPFEDPNAPSIENKANSTLDVIGSAESIYYADKNQDIFITIRLSNPDSYEILSFTLNGKKYSNYMFETGSDMENLVLKVNVGDVGGIVEYTIDAIKYVDGTDIKDVRMDGNRTVKAGVRANDQTYVSVTNEQKTMTSISFDAQVVDLYSLIEKSGGYAKAVLYDGVNMLTKDINVGEKTSIVFDNLTPNTVYQYGVVALYDDFSGNGVELNTLYKKAVHTDTIVLFKDIQIGKESVSWGYEWNSAFVNKQMSAISLWQNGAKVQDVDASATSVDDLKSNNEYTLKATYKNIANQDETIEITFVTLEKQSPTIEIMDASSTKRSIAFDIKVTDIENIGRISKIELLHNNDEPIVADNTEIRSFNNLLSNNEYTIKATYAYDLNDGAGERYIDGTYNIKTKPLVLPSLQVNYPMVYGEKGNQVSLFYDVEDDDEVGSLTIYIINLYGRSEPIVLSNGEKNIDNLFNNTRYELRYVYSYDLNDGNGIQQIVKTHTFATSDLLRAWVDIKDFTPTYDGASFTTTLFDNHTYIGCRLECSDGVSSFVINDFINNPLVGLYSNRAYEVKPVVLYDTNDGLGVRELEGNTIKFKTLERPIPVPKFAYIDNSGSSISAEMSFDDIANALIEMSKIDLYDQDTFIASTNDMSFVFNGLNNYEKEYTLKVSYTYDLKDGNGLQCTTSEIVSPKLSLKESLCINTSAVSKGETIYFEATIDNPSKVSFDRIKINDKYYTPSPNSTKTSIIVNIEVENQFDGGNTNLVVSEIVGTINGQIIRLIPSVNNSATVFVNGELNVTSITIVDESGNAVDKLIKGRQYYYSIMLANKTGYSIDEIEITSNSNTNTYKKSNKEIIEDSNNAIRIPVTIETGVGYVKVSKISYSNEQLNKTKENVEIGTAYICLGNEQPIVIDSVEDLKNMDGWGYYILNSDIDLKGVEWNTPGNFFGYFDGNGYSIKNLNFVGSVENCNFYWGLFNYAQGVIKDLTVTGRVMITLASTDGNEYVENIGSICESGNNLTLENVVSSINVNVTNNTLKNDSSQVGYIGGLACRLNENSIMINCNYSGSITSVLSIVGGLVSWSEKAKFINCYNTGTLSAKDYVGGLIGRGAATIESCYNTGDVQGYNFIGGLVGGEDAIIINNSYNTGNIQGSDYVGGLVGGGDAIIINNSYNTGNIQGNDCIGGLVGGGYDVAIDNSNNGGTITGRNSVGGLFGAYINFVNKITVGNSYNSGDITGEESVGGLVGGGYNTTANISNSYNDGLIKGKKDVGGIIGRTTADGFIDNTRNEGSVIGEKNVGGIVGHGTNAQLTKCYNIGKIESIGNIGGIIGLVAGEYVTILQCENRGELVCGFDSQDRFSIYACGGIIGYADWYVASIVIRNCYNNGDLYGYYCIGGLLGYSNYNGSNEGSIIIESSYNAASINSYKTDGERFIGGIIGGRTTNNYNSSVTLILKNCYSAGTIYYIYSNGNKEKYDGIQYILIGGSGSIEENLEVEGNYYSFPEGVDGSCCPGGEYKTLAEIIEIIKTKWDLTVWDFDHLDENGNPTLKK